MQLIHFYPLKGFEDSHVISQCGKIKSLRYNRVIKSFCCNGYLVHTLTHKGVPVALHTLLATTFINNPLALPVVNHIDGDKLNNAISNLEWVTHSQNLKHAYDTGLRTAKGEKNSQAILTADKVLKIRSLYAAGSTFMREIANSFGVSLSCVSDIVNNKTWKHI